MWRSPTLVLFVAVIEVNVVDTRHTLNQDLCFNTNKPAFHNSHWSNNSNSITLSAKTIREMGVDGIKYCSSFVALQPLSTLNGGRKF